MGILVYLTSVESQAADDIMAGTCIGAGGHLTYQRIIVTVKNGLDTKGSDEDDLNAFEEHCLP